MRTRLTGAGEELAETPKGERDHSMSGKGPNSRSHRRLGRVIARCEWRKLNCLNLNPQGLILDGDAAMVATSHRAIIGMQ